MVCITSLSITSYLMLFNTFSFQDITIFVHVYFISTLTSTKNLKQIQEVEEKMSKKVNSTLQPKDNDGGQMVIASQTH